MTNLNREIGMTEIDAVVFDAYGTLFDVHSVVQTAERLFPGRGAALSHLWRAKQLEYTWLRSLMKRHADFNTVTRQSLGFACAALNLPYSEGHAEELVAAYRELALFPDARSALTALRGRCRLAILSNGAPDMLDAVVAHNLLADDFSPVLSIESVGVFKPDPRVYQLAVDRLGIAPERIAFVSSNGWDAAGAKAFGLRVFWVNRGAAPVEQLDQMPDHILRKLDELPLLLA
jgi:2-haloacid dehalogenase